MMSSVVKGLFGEVLVQSDDLASLRLGRESSEGGSPRVCLRHVALQRMHRKQSTESAKGLESMNLCNLPPLPCLEAQDASDLCAPVDRER